MFMRSSLRNGLIAARATGNRCPSSRVACQSKQACRNIQRRTLFSEVWEPIQSSIQSGFISTREITGFSWAGSIAFSVVMVRTALFPLYRYHAILMARISYGSAEIGHLTQTWRRKSITIGNNIAEQWKAAGVFWNGIKAVFSMHEVSMRHVLLSPFANLAVFISFVWSIRDLVRNPRNEKMAVEFEGEEIFHHTGLHKKDRSLAFPLTAASLSYLTMEVSMGLFQKRSIFFYFKDLFQCVVLVMLPYTSVLPAGIFCYWIPSSLFGMAQIFALRNPLIRSILRIPPVKTVPVAPK